MLPEALDIAGYRVLGHCSGFGQGATVSNTAKQRGYEGSESTLGRWPENYVEVVMHLLHHLTRGGIVNYRATSSDSAFVLTVLI